MCNCRQTTRGVDKGVPCQGRRPVATYDSGVGCGLCKKSCNVIALELTDASNGKKKKQMTVNSDNCLGCGACISSCPTSSLSLVPLQRPEPPEKKRDLFKQILKEKKRLTPFVISGIKKKIRKTLKMG